MAPISYQFRLIGKFKQLPVAYIGFSRNDK